MSARWFLVLMAALTIYCYAVSYTHGVVRVGGNFTNEAPATYRYGDQLFRNAVMDSDVWWEKVSGQKPPPLDLYVYDQDDEGTAFGEYNGPRIWLTRVTRNYFWEAANDGAVRRSERRKTLALLWAIAAHERGHNLGLPHQPPENCPGNIMCDPPTRPWQALAWAKSKIPLRGPLRLP